MLLFEHGEAKYYPISPVFLVKNSGRNEAEPTEMVQMESKNGRREPEYVEALRDLVCSPRQNSIAS